MNDTPRTDAQMPDQVYKRSMYDHIQVLERELAEVTKQRDKLIETLEYIAHSGLSARHLVDEALKALIFIKK